MDFHGGVNDRSGDFVDTGSRKWRYVGHGMFLIIGVSGEIAFRL
jgi:hypothetical protein